MIGLDTNVLVRYLTLDDPRQSPRAVEILEHQLTEDEPGFVSAVVLAELSWVLARSYRWDRNTIAATIDLLLSADRLVIEHPVAAKAAASAMLEDDADFSDALIGAIAAAAGCPYTVTFDRRAQRLSTFQAPRLRPCAPRSGRTIAPATLAGPPGSG